MTDRAKDQTDSPKNPLLMDPWDWERFDAPPPPGSCYHYFIESMGDVRGKKILDAGCGDGWLSVILAKRGALVSGFDISAESIAIAKEKARANGVGDTVSFQVSSFDDIPYAADSFDLVVGCAILHHVDIEKILGPLRRVLRRDGKTVYLECFGNSRWLERLRLMVPVPIDDSGKQHWDKQMKYADIAKFNKAFQSVTYREFELFSRLDRVIKSEKVIRNLNVLDEWTFKLAPFLRRYARLIVFEAKYPRKD